MASPEGVGFVPSSLFSSIHNFRDVGKTINRFQELVVLREGRLFRSSRLDEASLEDRRALIDEYHVSSIIDLRSKTEHINQARKHDPNNQNSLLISQSKGEVKESLKIPHVTYHEINLNGKSFERALLWKLSWSSLGRLLSLMAVGYRTEAISILGREVMQPRGLIGLGKDSIDHAKHEIREILEVMANPKSYPLLIHCTQGKDRTGLSVLLLLLLLGTPLDAISADYQLSERELLGEKESRMKEIKEMGLGEDFAACPPGFVREIHDHINQTYGSLQEYMEQIGFSTTKQQAIKENMLDKTIKT